MSAPVIPAKNDGGFVPERRVNRALTASIEKGALEWMASRAPGWVSSDQLTALGFAAQIEAGVSYAFPRCRHGALLLVIVFSGAQAARRQHGWHAGPGAARGTRPQLRFPWRSHGRHLRFSGALMAGLGFSGFLRWQTAIAMLIAFLVLSGESYLATCTLSRFHLSLGIFGPRIFAFCWPLAISRFSTAPGARYSAASSFCATWEERFAAAILVTARNTVQLYREEPLS